MDWKKRTAALAAALLLALAPSSALAETWSTEDFSFQAPENMREFTLDTPLDDPGWALAGVAGGSGWVCRAGKAGRVKGGGGVL